MACADAGRRADAGEGAAHPPLPPEDARLLEVARSSIEHGLRHGRPLAVEAERFGAALRAPGASFVTLRRGETLRGCTGSLEPRRPLVVDVAENAFASAFRDPRFEPLALRELFHVRIHLSLLGPTEPLAADSEEALLAALRPGVDGLVIEEGGRRATFLPAVWEQIPDPRDFVAHLRRKAGLPDRGWSPALRVSRYEVREIGA